jgi:hypothetical protein
MFIAGDEYQTKAINAMFDVMSFKALSPNYWADGHRPSLSRRRLAASATIGKEEALYTQQAKNTRYIFTLVRNNPD